MKNLDPQNIQNDLKAFSEAFPNSRKKIGASIRRLRQSMGLSVDAFADLISVEPGTVRSWETNKTRPKAYTRGNIESAVNEFIKKPKVTLNGPKPPTTKAKKAKKRRKTRKDKGQPRLKVAPVIAVEAIIHLPLEVRKRHVQDLEREASRLEKQAKELRDIAARYQISS